MKKQALLAKPLAGAEAFRRACERNALRRHAQLPLLPIRDALETELRQDAAQRYYAAADHYHDDYLRIRKDVLCELRVEHGTAFGQSVGGRWVVSHHAGERFRVFLAQRGFALPKEVGTVYGSDPRS